MGNRNGYFIRIGYVLRCPSHLPMLIGGVARDQWEEKKLKPKIDAIKEEEGTVVAEKRALILLGTFMVAAGLLTGEAFFGTESSILSFIDSLWDDDFGAAYVALRKTRWLRTPELVHWIPDLLPLQRAGVIGGQSQDAELVEA